MELFRKIEPIVMMAIDGRYKLMATVAGFGCNLFFEKLYTDESETTKFENLVIRLKDTKRFVEVLRTNTNGYFEYALDALSVTQRFYNLTSEMVTDFTITTTSGSYWHCFLSREEVERLISLLAEFMSELEKFQFTRIRHGIAYDIGTFVRFIKDWENDSGTIMNVVLRDGEVKYVIGNGVEIEENCIEGRYFSKLP